LGSTILFRLVLVTPPNDTLRQNTAEQEVNKYTDGDMVTLITTVQQTLTGPQRADTERTGLLSL